MMSEPMEMLVKYRDDQELTPGLMEEYIIQVLVQQYDEFCDDFVNVYILPYGDVPETYIDGKKIRPTPTTYRMPISITKRELFDFFKRYFDLSFGIKESSKYIFFYGCEMVDNNYEIKIAAYEAEWDEGSDDW